MPITIQEDTADEFNWNTIETERDDNGTLLSRFIQYDNGTTRGESYENGTLRVVYQSDLGPFGEPSDVKPWETIETYYDANGDIEARFEVRDNGTTNLKQYEGGVLRYVEQTDLSPTGGPSDVKAWERIETYYDANGDLEARFQVLDDGVTTLRQYEAGVLRQMEQVDLSPTGGPSDARNWERIETFYDANGVIEARFELKDNGVTILKEYEAGVARVVTQEDRAPGGGTSDVKNWDSITAFYDSNGVIEARETIFDNGDVTAFLYEGGQRALRLQFDGDDSNSWLVRETIYDANNQVVAIYTYDTAEEVPPEYGFFDLV